MTESDYSLVLGRHREVPAWILYYPYAQIWAWPDERDADADFCFMLSSSSVFRRVFMPNPLDTLTRVGYISKSFQELIEYHPDIRQCFKGDAHG